MTEKVKKPRKKSLTLKEIEKQFKKSNTYSEYVYDKENNIIIKYYESFSEQKIHELLQELVNHIDYAKEKGYDIFTNDDEILRYLEFLIVKHFSEYKDKIGDNFEKNIAVQNEMFNIGLIHKFIFEIFDKNEVYKVYDRFYESVDLGQKLLKLPNELLGDLKEQLKNPEVLFNQNKKELN